MSKKKVLVTGATGMVGAGLISELLKYQYTITVLVRDAMDIQKFEKNGIKTILGDMTIPSSLDKKHGHFDIIFHLAASLRMFEMDNILKRNNIDGLKNILEIFCSTTKETRFIFASSVDAIRRENDYAKSKLNGEQIVTDFALFNSQTKFTNVRIGNVFTTRENSYEQHIRSMTKKSGWLASIISHQLGKNKLFPVALCNLSEKLTSLIDDKQAIDKTLDVYDYEINVGEIVKGSSQPRLVFGKVIVFLWFNLGKFLKRGDLLVYLASEK